MIVSRRLALAAVTRRRRARCSAARARLVSRRRHVVPGHDHRTNGTVTIAQASRSGSSRCRPTATESLFAIGAGPQVIAVDNQSDYPKSAPKTTLSGLHAERRGDRGLPSPTSS